MKYLPILQELFESDTVVFLVIGLAIGLTAACLFRSRKKSARGAAVSLIVYGVCEIVSNLPGSYLAQLIALFVGTVAIGGLIGFLVYMLFAFFRGRWKTDYIRRL